MFSSIYELPKKQLKRLEGSWAGTFYCEFFMRTDEDLFAVLYSDEPSRPNIPINVLMGLEVLKSGFGWSDEELYDAFCYNMQVRYALGYRDLKEGHFELRTLYNFRSRITQYMQRTGINLIEKVFEQVTDEQTKAFQLKTGKLRMDSTQIASNIREMSRLQLLVEVLQRVHRMLREEDQDHYREVFEPYLQGTSGQYVYRIRGEEIVDHLLPIGKLMHRLVEELQDNYEQEPAYQMLVRVFKEHYIRDDEFRPRKGKELNAGSLQSPDDWEATYRRKVNRDHRGYVANLTETCDPENDFQLINKVQVESNTTEDAAMLVEALPNLKERTYVEQIHTDGGYGSPDVDEAMGKAKVEQIQTAIRGRKATEEKLGLEDLEWEIGKNGKPQGIICPNRQRVVVQPGRKKDRYLAYFDGEVCRGCPFVDQCPTNPHKHKRRRVLRFSQRDVSIALRRKRSADARAAGKNLRAGVESTVRSVKHPFGNGKLPVRGKPRVSMMVIASTAMTNIRRIHGYEEKLREADRKAKTIQRRLEEALKNIFCYFCVFLKRFVPGEPYPKMAPSRVPV
jgi:hypothetical protein